MGTVAMFTEPANRKRVHCLSPMGEVVLNYAHELDLSVLRTHLQAEVWGAEIIWRRRGRPIDPCDMGPVYPAELGPTYEGLLERGYLEQTETGYALTPAGQAAATA